MSGCFGPSLEDRMRERELDKHLEEEFAPMECDNFRNLFATEDLDDNNLCSVCAKELEMEEDQLDDFMDYLQAAF